jgi:hypothetical protein
MDDFQRRFNDRDPALAIPAFSDPAKSIFDNMNQERDPVAHMQTAYALARSKWEH